MGDCIFLHRRLNAFIIPDGNTVTPINDVKTWLRCAGLNYAELGSPTLAQVVANSSLCATLMRDANARAYMIRSTTIQTSVLGSTTAVSAMNGASPFVSAYMTGTGLPSGYSASNWRAFSSTDSVAAAVDATSGWHIRLPSNIWAYRFRARLYYTEGGVYVYGSNTNTNWTRLLGSGYISQSPAAAQAFSWVANPHTGIYRYYRFEVVNHSSTVPITLNRCMVYGFES